MSYTIDNPPERIKGLPRHAQEIWIATYNNALKQYGDNEEKLNAIAWAAVKQKYEKDERGRWVLIDNSEGIMSVNTELHGRVPDEIQVIPFGRHNTSKGDFELDESSAAQVVTEFNSKTNDMVIDYEHQTLTGAEAPAAGWIKRLINKGRDGIWAVVEWTDRAKRYMQNKEYRYVSPVFLKSLSTGKVLRLYNVALTNQPNIDGMTPLINKGGILGYREPTKKEGKQMKKLFEVLGLPETASEDDAIQAVNKLKDASQVMANKEILDKLGLQEGATGKDVEQAILAMKAPAASKAVLEALGLEEGATESEVTGTIMAMKQSHGQAGELSQRVASLEQQLRGNEAADLVGMAMKEGKITPSQKEWAEKYAKDDPEGFKVFVAKAPVIVNMKNVAGGIGASGGAIDDVQMQVNKMLGLDEETFKKHNPKEGN